MLGQDAWYSELREKWRPEHVRLLLIGESAPDDGGDPSHRRFFYADTLTRHDSLFRGVVEAVFGVAGLVSGPGVKTRWLQRFREQGIFLIDLVPHPVNAATATMRAAARRQNVPDCVERAEQLQPSGIIVCHKPSFEALKQPLRRAGLPLLHDKAINFPLGNWRADFVRDFRAAYAKLGGSAKQP
jgi:hypothetical protein